MKILLVGHAFGAGLGSEPGLTWNWAWYLAANHEVWILAHPKFRQSVDDALDGHPRLTMHPVWVTVPAWLDPWDSRGDERRIRLHYLLWQQVALRMARRLHAVHHFDVVHHVSPGTISAPSLFHRLPIPFVWGPLGGGQVAPSAFRGYFGAAWRGEMLRTVRVRLLPAYPSARRAVGRAALLLATNRETADVLRRAGAGDVVLSLDNGLLMDDTPPHRPKRLASSPLTLLWAGRLEPRKSLPLAIEAMAERRHQPVRLIVAGDGPMRASWEGQAKAAGLEDRVQFLGQVPRAKMASVFRDADAFVFTSLRDSFGSVVLEAMAHALPILTLDHQGVGAFVPPAAGIKVPVTTPSETVRALAEGIDRLAQSSADHDAMGQAAWTFAREQTWSRRAEQMCEWYEQCLRREDRRSSKFPRMRQHRH